MSVQASLAVLGADSTSWICAVEIIKFDFPWSIAAYTPTTQEESTIFTSKTFFVALANRASLNTAWSTCKMFQNGEIIQFRARATLSEVGVIAYFTELALQAILTSLAIGTAFITYSISKDIKALNL
jgi:hypothetical protein